MTHTYKSDFWMHAQWCKFIYCRIYLFTFIKAAWFYHIWIYLWIFIPFPGSWTLPRQVFVHKDLAYKIPKQEPCPMKTRWRHSQVTMQLQRILAMLKTLNGGSINCKSDHLYMKVSSVLCQCTVLKATCQPTKLHFPSVTPLFSYQLKTLVYMFSVADSLVSTFSRLK